jgi:cholesterol oxidase
MDVYLGRGVGGGSLVNLAMLITPYRETLQRSLPSSIDVNEMYSTCYPPALAGLKGNKIRPAYCQASAHHKYARVACAQAAAKAGIPWRSLDSGCAMADTEQEEAGTVPKSALGNEGGFIDNGDRRAQHGTHPGWCSLNA